MLHVRKRAVYRIGLCCVFLGTLFVFVGFAPWYPELAWQLKQLFVRSNPVVFHLPYNRDVGFVVRKPDDALSAVARAQEVADVSPETNSDIQKFTSRIQIPSIQVDMPIVAGERDSRKALARGAWLIPGTSTPDQGGNTVISAHRFLYKTGAKTFYHLDKLKNGDSIVIEWDGLVKRYEVVEKKIVAATEVSILNQTQEEILTLFTCDPVFSTKNRLVVVAKPIAL